MIKGVRGAPDILPEETGKWQYVEGVARQILENYGYQEIRTPIFEKTELFVKGIGEGTDIVEKEMYTFVDRSQESLTLRPEGTAPVVRAYLEHRLFTRAPIIKIYYLGPMFRHERPQAGRFRQFHQLGAEAIGSENPAIDAEILFLLNHLFEDLGLEGIELQLNTIGCRNCRPEFRERFKVYMEAKAARLCPDCIVRLQRNPLRIMDCKEEGCQKVISMAPRFSQVICDPCSQHFRELEGLLSLLKVDYQLNERLVRGLDYYTRTTFEFINPVLGAQNAIAGGGRYDGLVEEIGGISTPAIGFALGMERVVVSLPEDRPCLKAPYRGVYVATLGDEAFRSGMLILSELRRRGFRASIDYENRSLKSQMRLANKEGYRFCIILGDEELKKGEATLRDMEKAQQERVPFSNLVDRLLALGEEKGA